MIFSMLIFGAVINLGNAQELHRLCGTLSSNRQVWENVSEAQIGGEQRDGPRGDDFNTGFLALENS